MGPVGAHTIFKLLPITINVNYANAAHSWLVLPLNKPYCNFPCMANWETNMLPKGLIVALFTMFVMKSTSQHC